MAKARIEIVGQDKSAAAWANAVNTAQGAVKKMKGLFTTAFVGLSVAGVAAFTKGIFDLGEKLSNATKKARINAEAFTELAYGAKTTGVEADALSNSFKFMQINISKAAEGSKEQSDAFRALGIDIKTFKSLAPEKQFEVIAEQISKLKNEEDAARVATALLGKSGADLLPMFEQGASGIRKLREEAQKMNQSFSADQLAKLDDAGDAVSRLGASFDGLATTLIAKVAPGLTRFFDRISGMTDPVVAAREEIAFLEQDINDFAKSSSNLSGRGERIKELQAFISSEETKRARARRARGEFNPKHPNKEDAPPGFEAIAAGDKAAEAAEKAAKKSKEEWDSFLKQMDKDNTETTKLIKDAWEDASEEVGWFNGGWNQVFAETMDEMAAYTRETAEKFSVFWEEGMRNMQDQLAQFLFDPFDKGIKGMLKGFVDVLRRMAAETAAANIFEKLFKAGGPGAGGKKGGFLNSLFNFGRSLFGFENGGSFVVGGQGGPDSQLVAFKASPNERVSITPPGQAGSGLVINNYVTVKGGGVTRAEVAMALEQSSKATIGAVQDLRRRGKL